MRVFNREEMLVFRFIKMLMEQNYLSVHATLQHCADRAMTPPGQVVGVP